MSGVKAALVLEDGKAFEGLPFAKVGEAAGETVLYTGVVGYQEVVTHPSYHRSLVVMTYPIIGACGVNNEDNESPGARAAGIIIREYSRTYSNWRATGSLEDFLATRGIVGIREVDTRAVAVHLRDHGEMRAAIVSGDFDPRKVAQRLKRTPSPWKKNLVRAIGWEGVREPDGKATRRIAVLNLGVSESLLVQLVRLGCRVDVTPETADAKAVLAAKPDGVILTGGPGDPHVQKHAIETARSLLGKAPLLGIGLGHQVLALALGCKVQRMKIGHHGVNYPVRDLVGGTSHITVQHHSFAVEAESAPTAVEVTHRNLNDGTVEGIRSKEHPAAGVQFHPTPDERERPSALVAAFCGID